jgi:hypothetical protein
MPSSHAFFSCILLLMPSSHAFFSYLLTFCLFLSSSSTPVGIFINSSLLFLPVRRRAAVVNRDGFRPRWLSAFAGSNPAACIMSFFAFFRLRGAICLKVYHTSSSLYTSFIKKARFLPRNFASRSAHLYMRAPDFMKSLSSDDSQFHRNSSFSDALLLFGHLPRRIPPQSL